MIVLISFAQNLKNAVPECRRLLLHEIELVRHRPPDVSICCQTCYHIFEVTLVVAWLHAVEAPMAFIVGMEENDVCFNAQAAELTDALLEMLKEARIEARSIPLIRRRALKRIARRLVPV